MRLNLGLESDTPCVDEMNFCASCGTESIAASSDDVSRNDITL